MIPRATVVERGRLYPRLRHCGIHGHDYDETGKTFAAGWIVTTDECVHCGRTLKVRVPAPGLL